VGGSEGRVIDFKTTENRDDCFDYDFDISTTHVNGEELVNLVVISGIRPNGDSTPLATAAGQTFFSFLSCKDWAGNAVFYGMSLDATFLDAIGDGGRTYPVRSFSCPRIHGRTRTGATGGSTQGSTGSSTQVSSSRSALSSTGDALFLAAAAAVGAAGVAARKALSSLEGRGEADPQTHSSHGDE